jgi:hypothetical protein
LSFEAGGQLKLRGSVPLSSVSFLKQTSPIPITLQPTTFEIGEDNGELEEYFGDSEGTPELARLLQNYPNPFNPSTTISFALRFPALVTLKVYNILGQEVATLIESEVFDDGVQEVDFDPVGIASGVYLYRLVARSTDFYTEDAPPQVICTNIKICLRFRVSAADPHPFILQQYLQQLNPPFRLTDCPNLAKFSTILSAH